MIEINLGISLLFFILASYIAIVKKGYGYLPIFLSCYFIFILIIPAFFHVRENLFPFYSLSYGYEEQYMASIILIVFSFFFWFGFFLINPRIDCKKRLESNPDIKRFICAMVVSYSILAFAILILGVDVFLTRRDEFDRSAFGANSSQVEFIIYFLRSLAFACLFYSILIRKKIKNILWIFLIIPALILFLIVNFPLVLPRFVLFSYLIAFFCYYIKPRKITKSLILIVFSLGVTTIFPFYSHITRREGDFSINMLDYYSSSGDFDGFQSIVNGVIFVNREGYTYGIQLFSSIFSFIPRSLWTGKSEPTGSILANAVGYDYTNISSPLPIEFYVDFGMLGLVFFSFLLGILLRKIDHFYVYSASLNLKFILAVIVISLIPIISRGALLAVLNNFYVELFVFIVIYLAIFTSYKKRKSI